MTTRKKTTALSKTQAGTTVIQPRGKKSKIDSPLLSAIAEPVVTKLARKPSAKKVVVTPDTTTTNGAVAYSTTYSNCLDFFVAAGNGRGVDLTDKFTAALKEDRDVALRTVLYTRDIRGGLGERAQFKQLMKTALYSKSITISQKVNLLIRTPLLGRFDDLVEFFDLLSSNKGSLTLSQHELLITVCVDIFRNNLINNPNGLAFKWVPVKGPQAKLLYKALGFKTEQQWRKFVVPQRNTVEQQMCAKQWDEIEFGKLPSIASARYQKAFGRNATEKYGEYIKALQKGEAKINAGALYPYDVIRSMRTGNSAVANQQWLALPDLIYDKSMKILPLIDVSGSMDCSTAIKGFSAKDLAISLGLYICEKMEGPFKDSFLTFDDHPSLVVLPKKASLSERYNIIYRAPWGGSTNIQRTFKVLLDSAVSKSVKAKDMPTHIIVLSDMQFNATHVRGRDKTAFDTIDAMYKEAGYKRPQMIFWCLGGSVDSAKPITIHDTGTAMVSGCSTAVLKTVLGKTTTPIQAMMETIMVDRYQV